MCCVQEVRWRGIGARYMGAQNRRYKMWWSGNDSGTGGVGILVKEELCEKVVEIHRTNDRIMTMVLVFGEEVVRVISVYGPQSGRPVDEKQLFYDELSVALDLKSSGEMVLCMGDFNAHVGKDINGFEGVHGGNGVGERNLEGRMLLEFCDEKELCVANTWFKKKEERKVTFRSGENKTEIDFVLVAKDQRKYLRDVKVIPGELQHGLIVVNINRRKLKKVIRKNTIMRRKLWKLKERDVRKRFEERVCELVDTAAPDLWKSFKDGVLTACDECCGKKKVKRNHGGTWWWNEEVRDSIAKKKEAHKALCKNRCSENKAKYVAIRNKTRKVVAKAMKSEAEKEIETLQATPNNIYKFLKSIKRDGKDVDGARCLKDGDGKLSFNEADKSRIWREHMEKIMNKENTWDHMADAEVVEGAVQCVTRLEIVQAIKRMKLGKATGPSEVSIEMITASGRIGIEVMLELCQRLLDGRGMPDEWKTSVVVPIYKGKGDVMSCDSYRGVKLLEHGMKVVERVLEKRLRALVNLDEMQFGFMPGKGTIDALFVLRRMQEEYREKEKKLYMCFVDLEKAFDRVPRKVVEWAMRKKGVPERMVRAVMDLYKGAKTKVKVGTRFSDEFPVKVGVHQGSVLSPLLFAIVMDEVTKSAKDGLPHEILYADDLVLMSDSMEGLREKFVKWRDSLEKKGMKVNISKTKAMVSGTEGELPKSKIDPCGVCGRRVMANSLLCCKCRKWIHGRCTKWKKVTANLAQNYVCKKCTAMANGVVEQVDEMCDGVEKVNGFCYLGDRINASGGSEAAVTARTRLGWTKFRECGDVLYGRRFSLKMKGKVYKSCVRSVMLYGSETWCLTEKELGILRRTERAMIRAMCGVKLMDRRSTKDLMALLGLNAIERVAKASAVRWYGHVLRREEDNILRKMLNFELDGVRKRGRPKCTWKRKVEEDVRKINLKMEDASDRAKWRRCVQILKREYEVNPATSVDGDNTG